MQHGALPEGVTWLRADVTDEASTTTALEGLDFDAVVNFLSYDAGDAERSVKMFQRPHETVRADQFGVRLRQAGAPGPDRRVDAHS